MSQNKKNTANDLAEQRLRERIKLFVDSLKNPEDIVQIEEISSNLRVKYPQEYQRKPDVQMKKQVEYHLNKLYSEVSKFFKKKDFNPGVSKYGVKKELKAADTTISAKTDETGTVVKTSVSVAQEESSSSDDEKFIEGKGDQSSYSSDSDVSQKIDQLVQDNLDEKLINFKSPNLLNQMLPHAITQKEQIDKQKEEAKKRKAEQNLEAAEARATLKKRQATDNGYGGFLKEQKNQEAMKELSEKYLTKSNISFKELGGMSEVIKQLREMIEWPLKYKNIFAFLGVQPPRGILISGPPGTGKTQLALAICGEYPDIPFYKLNGPEIVSRLSGQSEEKIRNIFNAVKEQAPAIIFIDELDSIAGKREDASKDMEVRIVAQLSACLDELDTQDIDIVVIGATTRPESIDQGLRRAGRFEKEISLGVPNEDARIEILKILTSKMRMHPEIDMKEIVKMTPGYVGADISTLCKEASIQAVSRIIHEQGQKIEADLKSDEEEEDKELENLFIELQDFKIASKRVQPSAQREGFSTVPNTTWKDVGALDYVRAELEISIVEPILHPEKFKRIGLSAPAGVLLYGPPGCGKTLVAKAVSNESKANFISIKGPELLNKYVGESEKAVRQLFKRARASAPCVIFFDELDSLCPRRGSENNSSSERVVNQLLTEMDGLDERRDVFVIAATNRPDIIDPAMLRPGRLDKLLYVPLPTNEDRYSILQTITRSLPVGEDVNLKQIAYTQQCDGYSGADLSALVREAQLNALKTSLQESSSSSNEQIYIMQRDFMVALQKVFPSVSKKDELAYQHLEKSLRKSRGHISTESK